MKKANLKEQQSKKFFWILMISVLISSHAANHGEGFVRGTEDFWNGLNGRCSINSVPATPIK